MGLKVNLPTVNENFSDDVIENNFMLYNQFKEKSEYFLKYNNNKVATSRLLVFTEDDQSEVKIVENGDTSKLIYGDRFVEKLNPDVINSKKFWDLAVKHFPFYSMVNSTYDITEMEKLLELSIITTQSLGILPEIDSLFTKNNYASILEIGSGYGSIASYLKNKYSDENYYAIDVGYYFWHERLFQCDGKSIPQDVPKDLDMVIASNVFAHLGEEQRKSYFNEIYKWLKPGGSFIFNMFLVTRFNDDKKCWQNFDKNGNRYCKFFNQLTKCQSLEELIKDNGYKFDIDVINLVQMNVATIKFIKK